MTTLRSTCRRCGATFFPTRDAIRHGAWKVCPACSPRNTDEHHCEGCGRVLRTSGRSLCLACLRGASL